MGATQLKEEKMGERETQRKWQAVVERDPTYDGQFYYSVRTTGVYCRPTCAARLPLRENVAFHLSTEDAERAGFRPCKRCRPNEPPLAERQAAAITTACRTLETADESLSLKALAEAAGMSPHYFHRTFKALTGVTPKGYAAGQRILKVQGELLKGETSVSEAIYEAGFVSSGRFYEAADGMLGMTATAYRTGGESTDIAFTVAQSSLGSILVARSKRGVCAILLGDAPDLLVRDLQDRFPNARLTCGDAGFDSLVSQVVGLVENPRRGLDLPLDVRGTAFQRRVWEVLREIPAGTTASYAEIAERIGAPGAVRAVAGACAANSLAVVIPCHRVVRSDGALSGYRWGIERKRELLRREGE